METTYGAHTEVVVKWEAEQSPNPGEYYLVGQTESGLCAYYAVGESGVVSLEDADSLPLGQCWPQPPAELVASTMVLAGNNDGLFPEDAEDDGLDEDDVEFWD